MMISLSQIEPCAFGSWQTVLIYAAKLRRLEKAPPIVLARQESKLRPFRVVDGAHRYHAAQECRRQKIKAVLAMPEVAK
jgi:hypothetical protein